MALNLTNHDWVANPETQYAFMSLLLCGFYLAVSAVLRKFDIGFSFIIRRFSNKQILKSYNFMWASILMSGIIIFQFIIYKTEIFFP